MTAVSVSTAVYSATHVATNMLRGLKQIVAGCGLDASKIMGEWVDGWSSTTLRSTSGMREHSIGTALGGGSIGAGLSWK